MVIKLSTGCIILDTFKEEIAKYVKKYEQETGQKANPINYLTVQNMVDVYNSLKDSKKYTGSIDDFLNKAFDIKYTTLGNGIAKIELSKDKEKKEKQLEKIAGTVKKHILEDAWEYARYIINPKIENLPVNTSNEDILKKANEYEDKFIDIFAAMPDKELRNIRIIPTDIKKTAERSFTLYLSYKKIHILNDIKNTLKDSLIAFNQKYYDAHVSSILDGKTPPVSKFAKKFIQNKVLKTLMYRSFVFDKPYPDVHTLDEVGDVHSIDTAENPIYVSQEALSTLYGGDIPPLKSQLQLRYTDFGLYTQQVVNKNNEVVGYYIYYVEDPTDTSKYVKVTESPVSEGNVLKTMDDFIKENLQNQTNKHNYQYAIMAEFIMSGEKDPQKIIDFITKGDSTIKTKDGEIRVTKEYLESLIKRVGSEENTKSDKPKSKPETKFRSLTLSPTETTPAEPSSTETTTTESSSTENTSNTKTKSLKVLNSELIELEKEREKILSERAVNIKRMELLQEKLKQRESKIEDIKNSKSSGGGIRLGVNKETQGLNTEIQKLKEEIETIEKKIEEETNNLKIKENEIQEKKIEIRDKGVDDVTKGDYKIVYQKDEYAHIRPTKAKEKLTDEEVEYFRKINDYILDFFDAEFKVGNAISKMYSPDFLDIRRKFANYLEKKDDDGILSSEALDKLTPEIIKEIAEELNTPELDINEKLIGLEFEAQSLAISNFENKNEYNNIINTMLDILYAYKDQFKFDMSLAEFTRDLIEKIHKTDMAFASKESSLKETTNPYERASGVIRDVLYRKLKGSGKIIYFSKQDNTTSDLDKTKAILDTIERDFSVEAFTKYLIENPKDGELFMKTLRHKRFDPNKVQFIKNQVEFFFRLTNNGENLRTKEEIDESKKDSYTYFPLFEVYANFANTKLSKLGIKADIKAKNLLPAELGSDRAILNTALINLYRNALASDVVPYSLIKDSFFSIEVFDTVIDMKAKLLERMGAMNDEIMGKINFIKEGTLEVKKEYDNLSDLEEAIKEIELSQYLYEKLKTEAEEQFKDVEQTPVSRLASLKIKDLQDRFDNYTQALATYLNTKFKIEIEEAYSFLYKLKPEGDKRSDVVYLKDIIKNIADKVKRDQAKIDNEVREVLTQVSRDKANNFLKSKQASFKKLEDLKATKEKLLEPIQERKAKIIETIKELSDLFKTVVKDPNLSIGDRLVKVNIESLLRSNSLENIVDKMIGSDYILINRAGEVVKEIRYPAYSLLPQEEASSNKKLQEKLTVPTKQEEISNESVREILRTIQEQVIDELPDTAGNTEFQIRFVYKLNRVITEFRKELALTELKNESVGKEDFWDIKTYHEKIASKLPEFIRYAKFNTLKEMGWMGTNFNADMNKLKEVDYLSPLYRRETAYVKEDVRPSFEDVVATVQKVIPVIEQIAGKDVLNLKVLKNIRFNNQFTFEDLAKTLVLCYGYDAETIQKMTVSEMMNELDKIHGYFTKRADAGFAGTIVLSANIKNLDSVPITAFHEAFHFIQSLLTPQERQVLKNRYGERWIEESAEQFAYFVIEERAIESSIVRNIFHKIMNFLRNMYSALTGFRNEMDIFRDAYQGKYAPSSSIDLKTFSETGVNAEDGVLLSMKSALNKEDDFIQTSQKFNKQERLLAGRRGVEENLFTAIMSKIRQGFKEYIVDGFFKGVFPKIASKETARELEQLRRALEIPKVATLKATRDIRDIAKDLSNYERTVMERLLILRDVVKNHDTGIQTEESILSQWDNVYNSIDEIREHLKELEAQKTPNIVKALEKRDALYKTMLGKLREAGYIKTDEMNSMEYFHRLVLRYHNMKTKLTPNKMKMLFTSALQPRTDTDLPFVTDYIYSEFEAFSQMYALLEYDKVINNINELSSDKVQGAIDRYVEKLTKEMEEAYKNYLIAVTPEDKRKYNGRYQILKRRLEYKSYYQPDQLKNIVRNDPELKKLGYDVYNLTDTHIYYDVFTMDKNIIRDIMSQEGIKTHEELKEGIKKRKAVRKFDKIVITKTEVIETMKDMFKPTETSPIAHLLQKIQTFYKVNILLNPFNALRYLTNNTSGDLDIVLAYDYRILAYAKDAFSDLLAYFKKEDSLSKEKLDELDKAISEGIISSGISVHELPELYKLPNIKELIGKNNDKWFKRILNYPHFISQVNNIRESTLRLATYRYFNDKLSKNQDTPIYAASNSNIIDGLKTKEEKVARLTRDLIGDYGNISPNGRWLRKTLIPFWSWTEINIPRYVNLLRNANKEYTGKAAAKMLGIQTGKAVVKMASLYAAILLYNGLKAPDDSDELLNNSYGQLRLVVSNDNDGTYGVVRFQGAFSDALGWIVEDPPVTIDGMLKGKLSTAEVMKNLLTTPSKKIFQGLSPFLKAPVELYLGMTTFPRPRAIRDNAEYVANLLGLRTPYRIVNPSIPKKPEERGFYNSLKELVASSALRKFDSREVAYFRARDLASKFAEENNLNTARILPNKKSTEAYLFKKSMKYQDYDAALTHLTKYLELGGSRQGLQQSLRVEHPLYSIDKKYRPFFLKTLPEDDRKLFEEATRWYESIYLASFNNPEFERIYREAQRKAVIPKLKPLYES